MAHTTLAMRVLSHAAPTPAAVTPVYRGGNRGTETQEVWFRVCSGFQALPLDMVQDPMLEDGSGAEDGTECKQGVFTKTDFLP